MKKKIFPLKTELLNFKITLPLAKLDMASSRLVSSGLILLDDIPVNIQVVTFLLLYDIRELSTRAKNQKALVTVISCKIHSI